MLTRALLIGLLFCGGAVPAFGDDAKLVALGLADHEVSLDELAKGAPPVPKFNTPAIAYVAAANLKQGDVVEISLANTEKALLTNTETLAKDMPTYLLQAGKRGVPAGGWPSEWSFAAQVKITREGKTLIEQATKPVPFE